MSLLHHFYDDEMLEKQDSSIVSFSKEDCYETNCIGELMALFFWHTTVCSLQLHIYLAASTEKNHLKKASNFCSRTIMELVDIDNVEAYSLKSSGESLGSDFDRLIQFAWQQKMDEGSFRYPFKHPQCKKLSGHYNYLAQFNSFRVIILISR